MSVFSENLRRIRTQKDITQGKLAEVAGIAQAAISQLENATRPPTPAMLQKLSNALGVEPSELQGADIGTSAERAILLRNMNKLSPDELDQLAKFSDFLVSKQKQDRNPEGN